MKVLVLDDGRKQAGPIREAFSRKKIDAVVCSSSNEFMTALHTTNFETVYINAETWNKGKCIYDYFGAGPRLNDKPAVFYNVDEKFTLPADRTPNEQDRVVAKPSDIDAVLETEAA
jgi:hypothetical protein